MGRTWKKGRGKLGFMQPLLGSWSAETEKEGWAMHCTRVFEEILGGSYVRMAAHWKFKAPESASRKEVASAKALIGGRVYEEIAIIGAGDGGKASFWSFTSDGKRSQGTVADVADVHKDAVGFEAQMPAGLARMIYWPDDEGGFFWAVEAKSAKGWKRFMEHHYRPA